MRNNKNSRSTLILYDLLKFPIISIHLYSLKTYKIPKRKQLNQIKDFQLHSTYL